MSNKNKHINYNAGDIEMYLAGKLSAAEMHAMEKAALDDPFLNEAIEGYEGMKDTEWNNELVALRSQIAEKGTVAKVIPLHKARNNWWKTAAAVFILGGGVALTFLFTRDDEAVKNNTQIAQTITGTADSISGNETVKSVTESLNPTASSTKEALQTNKQQIAQTTIPGKSNDLLIPDPTAPQLKPVAKTESVTSSSAVSDKEPAEVVSTLGNNNPSTTNRDVQMAEQTIASKAKTADKPLDDAEVLKRQKSEVDAFAKKEAALNNFFTAQVVGSDNNPLPFTNISIKKDNFGTYADAKGMVRLVSTDSILNVEVKSVGYLPKTITLRNSVAQTKIILQEDEMAYNAKTVIGNAAANRNQKSRRATLLTDSAVNVEPADGWENYNTYVANNLQIPEDYTKGEVHGSVELSFDVKANGTITNIRVNKSLGSVYDEAAKRLIMEGPQWKVKKGRKTSANVKVQF